MSQIVLASNNPGKIKELTLLLKAYHQEVIPQSHYHADEVSETGLSFVENALLKARHASAIAHLPAIADDSGLCIPALNNEPGIYSARYAGADATNTERIIKVLNALQAVPTHQRQATFHCVIVYLQHEKDPVPVIAHGTWTGTILTEPQGQYGFGYDPIFFVPEYQCSAAELTPDIKNKISHRAKALTQLMQLLRLEIKK